MVHNQTVIEIECPVFLGGKKKRKGAISIDENTAITSLVETVAEGIYFKNAPNTLPPIVRDDGTKLHILSDEFELLFDAFAGIKKIEHAQGKQSHFVTLRDGLLTIEASGANQDEFRVSVRCAKPYESFTESVVHTSFGDYIADWRELISRIPPL